MADDSYFAVITFVKST